MSEFPNTPLVSAADLAEHLDNPNVVILNATPNANPTDEHIPSAQVADIEGAWSDHEDQWVHTFPKPALFEAELQRLGINSDTHVVVYEDKGVFARARIWWLLKWAGHEACSLLAGDLTSWKAAGYPTTTEVAPARTPGNITVEIHPDLLLDETETFTASQDGSKQILDARSAGRFAATEPEPRPGLRGGHIPGSTSMPYVDLVTGGTFKPVPELQGILESKLDGRPVIASCGSGVTACVIAFALELIGRKDVQIYEGSWSQWGRPDGPPVETGI